MRRQLLVQRTTCTLYSSRLAFLDLNEFYSRYLNSAFRHYVLRSRFEKLPSSSPNSTPLGEIDPKELDADDAELVQLLLLSAGDRATEAAQVAAAGGRALEGTASVAIAGADGLWVPHGDPMKHFVPSAARTSRAPSTSTVCSARSCVCCCDIEHFPRRCCVASLRVRSRHCR